MHRPAVLFDIADLRSRSGVAKRVFFEIRCWEVVSPNFFDGDAEGGEIFFFGRLFARLKRG